MSASSVADAVDRLWAREAARLAIRENDRETTFGELLRWSGLISQAIEPSLHGPGERVALLLPNSAAFVAAFFAVARLGGVVSPLSTQYRSQEIAYYLTDLDPAAVVIDPRLVEPVVATLARIGKSPAVIEVSGAREVRTLRPARGATVPVAAAGALLQQYTSGSTGVPKRVVRTHAALRQELDTLRGTFGVEAGDRFLGVTPFSHVNGLVRTMMTAMWVGAALYPMEEFRRREVLDRITSERITCFGGVPQMFAILSQTPPRGHIDLTALRLAFSSSAPLLPEDNRRFQARYGIVVRQLYGSTETGTISFNGHPVPESCPESVGLPIAGVYVRVVDERGTPLPGGEEGELAIESPFAASGYLGNEAATRESFRDSTYFSGDLGTRDASGYIRITGRKKLLINRGGFKVNPYEVEAAIKEHPKVGDVAVFGSPGPHGDDVVCAAIVATESCTTDEILSHCRDRIADFKIPTRIEFRDALPTSATGKVLRGRLLE